MLVASGISFAAGLPGVVAMPATVPLDLAQFYGNGLNLAQKLAYLYGWPDLLDRNEVDEETELHLTLLLGVMLGANGAIRALNEVARRAAEQAARRIPRMALTKSAWYPIIRQVAKWLGVAVTKQTFARGVSRFIPIVGGAISAGVTAATLRPMAKRLQRHLRTLKYALPSGEADREPPISP